MYNEAIRSIIQSNIGSFIKEDLINNELIKKDKGPQYYSVIIRIARMNISGFLKEKILSVFLNTTI